MSSGAAIEIADASALVSNLSGGQRARVSLGTALARDRRRWEMNRSITSATAQRVIWQLRRDPRTVALLLVIPCALITLMKFVMDGQEATFDRVGVPLLGIFPFITMFLATSITMLRERTTGTLERLMTMPLAKRDVLAGYAGAFGIVAVVQAALVCAVGFGALELVAGQDDLDSELVVDVAAVVDFMAGALVLGALTLRRRTAYALAP